MKKFLFALICAVAIGLAGCTSAPTGTNPADMKLPTHIQKIEDDTNKILKDRDKPGIEIIDYRDDGLILWMWTDNLGTPDTTCDFVLVLGIHSKGNGDRVTYTPLFVITKENSWEPCQEGYTLYYKNEQEKKEERLNNSA